jgi:hypothetical protein
MRPRMFVAFAALLAAAGVAAIIAISMHLAPRMLHLQALAGVYAQDGNTAGLWRYAREENVGLGLVALGLGLLIMSAQVAILFSVDRWWVRRRP